MYLMAVSLDRIGALSTLIVLSCYFLCGCLMFWSVFCLSERMTRAYAFLFRTVQSRRENMVYITGGFQETREFAIASVVQHIQFCSSNDSQHTGTHTQVTDE